MGDDNTGVAELTATYESVGFNKIVTISKRLTFNKNYDAISVGSLDVEYAVNNNATTPPVQNSNLWKSLPPTTLMDGEQLWTRTVVSYTDSEEFTYTTPVNITPKKGRGIFSIKEQYLLWDTDEVIDPETTLKNETWYYIQPEWEYDKYI